MCAQVEAKYPALLFKQQLDAFVQKIFPMLRDNVKKEVTPQLAACIHAPRAATQRSRRGSQAAHAPGGAHHPGDAPGARGPSSLDQHHTTLKQAHNRQHLGDPMQASNSPVPGTGLLLAPLRSAPEPPYFQQQPAPCHDWSVNAD